MGVLSMIKPFMKPETKELIAKFEPFEPVLDVFLKQIWDPLDRKITETHELAKENNIMLRSIISDVNFKYLVGKKLIKERR